MLDLLVQLVTQSAYGALIMVIVMPAALVYGVWQGLRRVGAAIRKRGTHGNAGTG